MDQKPTKLFGLRIAVFIGGVVGLALVCAGLETLSHCPKNGIRIDELEADLRASVPPGSPRAQAEDWFARHGIQFGLMTDLNTKREVGYAAQVDNSSWLETADIRITIGFDERGQVTKVSIERVVMSL